MKKLLLIFFLVLLTQFSNTKNAFYTKDQWDPMEHENNIKEKDE